MRSRCVYMSSHSEKLCSRLAFLFNSLIVARRKRASSWEKFFGGRTGVFRPSTLAYGANPCPSPLLRFPLHLAHGIHKRTAIQLPRQRYKHKSRALSRLTTPGFFTGPKLLELRFLSPSAADCLPEPPVAHIFAPVSA